MFNFAEIVQTCDKLQSRMLPGSIAIVSRQNTDAVSNGFKIQSQVQCSSSDALQAEKQWDQIFYLFYVILIYKTNTLFCSVNLMLMIQ